MPLFHSVFTSGLTILTVLIGLLYWYCTNTFDYWRKKGIPHEPPVPFFGNIMDTILMKRNFGLVHQELYERFKGHRFLGIYMTKKPALMLRDPNLIKAFLVKDFPHFHDRDIQINFEHNPLHQHLFTLQGSKWRILRNKLSPTFTSGKMKMMFSLMEECSDTLINYLQEAADKEEIVEITDILAKFATDIVGNCVFGLQVNAINDPNSEFRRMGKKVFETSIRRRLAMFILHFSLIMPELGKWIRVDGLGKELTKFYVQLVKETAEYRLKNNVNRNDFMQLLINLRYKGKVDDEEKGEKRETSGPQEDDSDFEFDDGLMTAQAFVFFVAGFETASSAMSFTLHELVMNPDIQTKLREEIDAELKENGGKFTYESITKMKYLDQVISETLRKHTPIQFLRRKVTIPYTIPGTKVTLDKGVSVVVPIYAIHNDPKYYPDPERFDPERFSDEEKAKRHNYVYLPFGEGPRNCIGMRFGLLQTKLGVASLLSKYEFRVCERTEYPIRLNPKSLILASTAGTIVRITRRK